MFRRLKIVVDGVTFAELAQGNSVAIDLPEEAEFIWGEMDWAKTEAISLNSIDAGKTIVFKSYFSLNVVKNLGVTNMPFKVFIKE